MNELPNVFLSKFLINSAVFMESILMIICAVMPYLAFRNYTPNLIIEREELEGERNYVFILGKFLYVLELGLALPLSFCPARNSFSKMVFGTPFKNNTSHFFLTVLVLSFTTLIAIIYPNVISILSIVSGTICTLLAITFPSVLYLVCHPTVFFLI